MLIKTDDRPVYVHCKNCNRSFKMGKSCSCGSVRTSKMDNGAYLIEEDGDSAIVDTE